MSLRRAAMKRTCPFDCLEDRRLLSLTVIGQAISATAQSPFTGAVASLIDSNIFATPSDFNTPPGSVEINWGDGTPQTPGTVVSTLIPGVFQVDGSHTFTQANVYTTTIAVQDQSGNTGSNTGSANVAVAPLTIAVNNISGTANQAIPTQVIATILNMNSAYTQSSFNALINWGDGQTTGEQVQGSNGAFRVADGHTYTTAGMFTVTVTIVGLDGAPSGSATGVAAIAPASPPSSLTGTSITAVAGQPLPSSTTVATFFDTNTSDMMSNPSAVIEWGDGGATKGVVSGTYPNFTVSGTYTYAQAGPFMATVVLTDSSGNNFSATDTVTVLNSFPGAAGFSFTGMLAAAGNGPRSQIGYTNTNEPTFTGIAPPFSTIQLYARPFGVDTELPLGETVAGSTGQWILSGGPLVAGTYNVSATFTPSGGTPSTLMPLTTDSGLVHIDMKPKIVHHKERHKPPKPPHPHPHHPIRPSS